MNKRKENKLKKKTLLLCITSILLLASCNQKDEMKDGYYTAETSNYSHGWKEYICILVKDNQILSAEYNAKNESGFIKAWDNAYMKNMKSVTGSYPNAYTRNYVKQLIEAQNSDDVDMVSGASSSGALFHLLAEAVIEQAIKGDPQKAIVETEEE